MEPTAANGEVVYVSGGGYAPGLWIATASGLVPFPGTSGVPLQVQRPMTSPTASFKGFGAAVGTGLVAKLAETLLVGAAVEILAALFTRGSR